MQIDTWNRDKMNISHGGPVPFVPGPVPKSTLAPVTGSDAIYSGLLECPMTTRIGKVYSPGSESWNGTQAARVFSCTATQRSCGHNMSGAAACFAASLRGLEGFNVTTATVHDASTPPGCTVAVSGGGGSATITYNTNALSTACCSGGVSLVGSSTGVLKSHLEVSSAKSEVKLTLTGPAAAWFGIGFGATLMADSPYAIIVDGAGTVTERKLANHAAGAVLSPSVKVLSNAVKGGLRSVVLSRSLKGASAAHYSFDPTGLSIDLIEAVGASSSFGYHKARTAATIRLWPSGGAPACVCSLPAVPFGQGAGQIKYLPTGETVGFPPNRCAAYPQGELIQRHNPTCDLRTYTGGLATCHHGWSLLDAEQEVPWADQPLVLYKKYRIYFQEFDPQRHKQIERHDWGIGADGDHSEYDVPKCAAGTPIGKCTHQISGAWVPVPAGGDDKYLVLAHHHCHAPTCLRVELCSRPRNSNQHLERGQLPAQAVGFSRCPSPVGADREQRHQQAALCAGADLWRHWLHRPASVRRAGLHRYPVPATGIQPGKGHSACHCAPTTPPASPRLHLLTSPGIESHCGKAMPLGLAGRRARAATPHEWRHHPRRRHHQQHVWPPRRDGASRNLARQWPSPPLRARDESDRSLLRCSARTRMYCRCMKDSLSSSCRLQGSPGHCRPNQGQVHIQAHIQVLRQLSSVPQWWASSGEERGNPGRPVDPGCGPRASPCTAALARLTPKSGWRIGAVSCVHYPMTIDSPLRAWDTCGELGP